MALALRATTQAGAELLGDAALAYPGEPQESDVNKNIAAARESGVRLLIRILSRSYGADNQQTATGAIDLLYDLRRVRRSLLEYIAESGRAYEEAGRLGGFHLKTWRSVTI